MGLTNIENIIHIVENQIQNTQINSLVIDAKDIVGYLTYKSKNPFIRQFHNYDVPIKDFNKLIQYLHDKNIYVIIRLALFHDMFIPSLKKDWGIVDKNSPSGILEVKRKPAWLDPGKKEVQSYLLQIYNELLSFGPDEIQFDYVRYPAEGNLEGVIYSNVLKREDKVQNLKNFIFQAYLLKYSTQTKLSLDVFGITGWGEEKDIFATGQNIPEISIYLDYISPMLYPSHFNRGFEGIDNPADHPEYFYSKGLQYFHKLIPEYVKIRPWIQAFKYRVANYNEAYIVQQIKTIGENNGYGYIFWNASNNYTIPLKAIKKYKIIN